MPEKDQTDSSNQENNLGEKVKTGYLWTLVSNGLGQPVSFLFGIVLARILSPSDFGIIASCLIFTEIGSTLVGSSYVSGLTQRKKLSGKDISTGFVLQLISGVALAVIVSICSPLASHFFNEKLISPVLSLLSINFILLAFCGVPTVIARRNLNFKLITKAEISEKFSNGAIAAGLAVGGFGVYSLVVGRLVGRVIYALVLIFGTKWKPSFKFDKSSASSLYKICFQFASKEILDDTARNIDYFLVGGRLGMSMLGFYSRAYYLMTLPITNFSRSLGRVLFPAFSLIQDDDERLIRGLLKSNTLIAITTFPILAGIMLVAPTFIPFVYGAKWIPSVVPLQIICFAGIFYAIEAPAISIINARAFLIAEIKRQLIHMLLLVAGVLIGSYWGIIGVSWGVSITAGIYWFLVLNLLKRKMGVSILIYLKSLLPAIFSSLIMIIGVFIFQRIWFLYANEIYLLFHILGSVFIGIVIYFIALFTSEKIIRDPQIQEAFSEIHRFIGSVKYSLFKLVGMQKS
jgi:PST family polysaccharide transporter